MNTRYAYSYDWSKSCISLKTVDTSYCGQVQTCSQSDNDPTNIEYYNILKHNHNLKFGGISFSIKMEDIPEWEEMNDIPIAVYGVKENGEEVYPLENSYDRDKSRLVHNQMY